MNKLIAKKILKTFPAFFFFFLFIFTVSFLKYKGYINPIANLKQHKDTPEDLNRVLTDIKIADINIKNKILFEENSQLKIYDPSSNQENILVKEKIIDEIGILADGRIYFWQKPDYLYEWLYIQKGLLFEKFKIKLQNNDGGNNSQTPPLVSTDGNYIIFTSDRDSQDNYFRRSLYKFNLETRQTQKLTSNKTMTIHSAAISPDSKYIAFTYQDFKSNQPAAPISLGIIFADTKTPNLFPKIQINNTHISFSSDSQFVFLNAQKGPIAFEIAKGKISDSLEEGTIITVSPDNILAITTEYKVDNIDFFKNCLSEEEKSKNYGNYQINLFQFTDGKFTKLNSYKAKNALINFQSQNIYYQFSGNNEDVLISMQNNDFCQKAIGFFNFNTSTVNPTNLPLDKNLLWIR